MMTADELEPIELQIRTTPQQLLPQPPPSQDATEGSDGEAEDEASDEVYRRAALYIDDAMNDRTMRFGKGEYANTKYSALQRKLLNMRLSGWYQSVLRLLLAGQLFLVFVEPPGVVLAYAYCSAFYLYCLGAEIAELVIICLYMVDVTVNCLIHGGVRTFFYRRPSKQDEVSPAEMHSRSSVATNLSVASESPLAEDEGETPLSALWNNMTERFHERFGDRIKRVQWLNVVQTVIVFIMLVDLVCAFSFSYIRAARILRPMLLLIFYPRLLNPAKAVMQTIPHLLMWVAFAGMLLIVYSIIGVALFKADYLSIPASVADSYPDMNFTDFFHSMLSMFVLMTSENYPDIMYPAIVSRGYWAILYFWSFLCIGTIIMFSLLTALVASTFLEYNKSQVREIRLEARRLLLRAFRIVYCKSLDPTEWKRPTQADDIEELSFEQWNALLQHVLKPSEWSKISPLWEVTRGRHEVVDKVEFLKLCDNLLLDFRVVDQALPGWRGAGQKILKHFAFNYAEVALTIVHVGILAGNRYGIGAVEAYNLWVTSSVLLCLFVATTTARVIILQREAFKDYFMVIEKILTYGVFVVWLVTIITNSVMHAEVVNGNIIQCLLSLRVLHLVTGTDRFALIGGTLTGVLPSIITYFWLLLMIVYTFLIIGLEMLGGVEPLDMFVTFSSSTGALLGLLQVFTTSNWHSVMFQTITNSGNFSQCLFFLVYFLIVVTMFINVLIGLMIEAWKFYYFEQRLIIERVYRNHATGTFDKWRIEKNKRRTDHELVRSEIESFKMEELAQLDKETEGNLVSAQQTKDQVRHARRRKDVSLHTLFFKDPIALGVFRGAKASKLRLNSGQYSALSSEADSRNQSRMDMYDTDSTPNMPRAFLRTGSSDTEDQGNGVFSDISAPPSSVTTMDIPSALYESDVDTLSASGNIPPLHQASSSVKNRRGTVFLGNGGRPAWIPSGSKPPLPRIRKDNADMIDSVHGPPPPRRATQRFDSTDSIGSPLSSRDRMRRKISRFAEAMRIATSSPGRPFTPLSSDRGSSVNGDPFSDDLSSVHPYDHNKATDTFSPDATDDGNSSLGSDRGGAFSPILSPTSPSPLLDIRAPSPIISTSSELSFGLNHQMRRAPSPLNLNSVGISITTPVTETLSPPIRSPPNLSPIPGTSSFPVGHEALSPTPLRLRRASNTDKGAEGDTEDSNSRRLSAHSDLVIMRPGSGELSPMELRNRNSLTPSPMSPTRSVLKQRTSFDKKQVAARVKRRSQSPTSPNRKTVSFASEDTEIEEQDPRYSLPRKTTGLSSESPTITLNGPDFFPLPIPASQSPKPNPLPPRPPQVQQAPPSSPVPRDSPLPSPSPSPSSSPALLPVSSNIATPMVSIPRMSRMSSLGSAPAVPPNVLFNRPPRSPNSLRQFGSAPMLVPLQITGPGGVPMQRRQSSPLLRLAGSPMPRVASGYRMSPVLERAAVTTPRQFMRLLKRHFDQFRK